MSAANDLEMGRQALVFYHNECLKYPQNYSLSFDQLFQMVNDSSPTLLQALGNSINTTSLTVAQVQTAMTNLADQGEGKLPEKFYSFFDALVGQVENISFVSAVVQSTEQAVSTAASVATTTIGTTLKVSSYVVPVAIAAALFLVLQEKGKAWL